MIFSEILVDTESHMNVKDIHIDNEFFDIVGLFDIPQLCH